MYDETVALLKKVDPSPGDRIIFLGDYVDRGPKSAGCIDLVRQREQLQGSSAGIMGNHEEKHLHYERLISWGEKLDESRMPASHIETRKQLRLEHYEWMRFIPFFIRVPEHNVVAVHAGAWPGRPIEAQEPQHLLHIQSIRPFDEEGKPMLLRKSKWPSRVPDNEPGWAFWTTFWQGPETIVFGHSVLDKPLITEHAIGIDGGAVFGRQLHAYVLPEKQIVTVDATTDFGKGRRGQPSEEEALRGNKIRKFLIHGDVSTFS